MATATEPKIWTTEDLLAMPDDGVERWIINGKLREKRPEIPGVKMTVRNRHHCRVMSYTVTTITNWLRTQPRPRGEVYSGKAGVRLKRGAGTTVGIDVAYAPPEVVEVQSDDETKLLDGTPTLAVEILSPNDTQEQIIEKVRDYLAAGVASVWNVEPTHQIVTVYRPGEKPLSFNDSQRIPAIPEMPGFSPSVAELFE